ncbi:MAG: saccharopine dehydrogenase NADP-binding domain-containing protein [Gammaproteobacteria bacterium]|nr:saccharopine dehydrogenase NADP-binding domain-containing protein [Gammaproteobacteria bacterium]
MTQVGLVGGGKIGEMICDLLIGSGDYSVTLIDASQAQLDKLPDSDRLTKLCLDVTDTQALSAALDGHFAVLSACPFYLTRKIARAAVAAEVHYLDLTEDMKSTELVRELADNATTAFIPQCGLAPGFISIVAHSMCEDFDELDTVRLRVGALPMYPTNSLTYNLTWSTDGVINEYCEPCESIMDGERVIVPALTQREEFSLDGIKYETFNTSGGLGSLAETLAGKVNNLSYQTIRYPGHREIMKTLLQDLRLSERRELLKDILEYAVPATYQDVVFIFVTVSGKKDGRLLQDTYANKIYGHKVGGVERAAIQITTASAICTMLDLLHEGLVPTRGCVRQEQVRLEDFLANRFGQIYVPDTSRQQPPNQ